MNFPFYIARRYLISKKSHNIINIISAVSVMGVMVGTMGLIVVLSVFNGFEDLVKSLFNTFNPDMMIAPKIGKTFDPGEFPADKIRQIKGIVSYTEVVEENALLKHNNEQYIATLKGVSDEYFNNNPLDTMILDGGFFVKRDNIDYAVLGYLVAYNLGIRINDYESPVIAYVPKRTTTGFTTFDQSFNTGALIVSGVFSVQQEIDSEYVIVPIDFIRSLLEYENEVTGIELRLEARADSEEVQEMVEQLVGNNFNVKNRFQQQALLYKIMRSEKWAIFLILTFIIIIATFNVIGSLSMLILDKRKDIAVFYSLGASDGLIKKIFLTEGVLISAIGAISGLVLGFILCWLQIEFGLIKLGSDPSAFVIPHYPVKMQLFDFIGVFATVFVIGLVAAWYPVRQISKKYLKQRISEFNKAN
jgi:lipoprotein-releasing system permease protein